MDQQELIPPEWLQEEPQAVITRAGELLKSEDLLDVRRARKLTEIILQIDRPNPGLVFMIGSSYMREGRWAFAEHWLRRALAMDAQEMGEQGMAPMHCNLGFVLQQEGRNDEAEEHFSKAVELDPNQAEYMNNLATMFVNNGTPEEAIERCTAALEADPDNKDAEWNRGLAYLELGHWKEGWEGYEKGLHKDVRSSQTRKTRPYTHAPEMPYWDGEKGQKVVVYGEQGVGDEILAVSMLEELADDCETVMYESHPRLVNIMRYNFGNRFPIYGTRKIEPEFLQWPHWESPEYKLPILNLGKFYRQKDEDFPREVYLKPFDNLVDKYKEKLRQMGDRPKIGISWKGGGLLTRHDLRSIPLPELETLFKSVDADWISLQYDAADRPGWNTPIVAGFEEQSGVNLNHDPAVVNDLDECYAGLIHALDLVITVNTSLVHACGAFGVPTWVLTPKRPAWRYNTASSGVSCGPDKMIWYGNHIRQIRAEEDNWNGVLETVQTDLQAWLSEVTAA